MSAYGRTSSSAARIAFRSTRIEPKGDGYVDAGGEFLGGEHALLDQQRAHGLLEDLVGADGAGIVILARRVRVAVVVGVVVWMRVVVAVCVSGPVGVVASVRVRVWMSVLGAVRVAVGQ